MLLRRALGRSRVAIEFDRVLEPAEKLGVVRESSETNDRPRAEREPHSDRTRHHGGCRSSRREEPDKQRPQDQLEGDRQSRARELDADSITKAPSKRGSKR